MYKICFYVPETHCDAVKMALFEAGAGKMGDYDCCAWQVKGQGQFRPLDNSKPFIGQTGVVETIDEVCVEMVCEDALINDAIAALKKAHPYEEPAYQAWVLTEV